MNEYQFHTIYLGTDHAGFTLKESIRQWLVLLPVVVIDCGAQQFDAEDDFPDYIFPAVRGVQQGDSGIGAIIFGGSGQGEAMAANRLSGVRATVYYGAVPAIVPLGREHNDANVLSIGARFVTEAEAQMAIMSWLTTPTRTDEKYRRRNQKIEHLAKS